MWGTLRNLIALSTALMLPVQSAITVCSPDAMAASALQSPLAVTGHHHSDHGHAHHFHEHSGGHSHTADHDDGHKQGSGPCECSPQKSSDVTVPRAVIVSSPQDDLIGFNGLPDFAANALIGVDSDALSPAFAALQKSLEPFQGNPCAHFCRWLI